MFAFFSFRYILHKFHILVIMCVHLQVSIITAPVRSLSLYFCLGDQQWQHWFMGVRNLGCCHGNATLQYCVQADRACCSVDTRTGARTVSVAGETCWMLISSSSVCPSSDQRNTQDLHYWCALTLSLYILQHISTSTRRNIF